MKIVAGKYGSRPLKSLEGINTRPTSGKVKESIFNMLGHQFHGGRVLDFYGGSGALAIEAVSRGMDQAVITEKSKAAWQIIQKNIEVTKEADKFTLLIGDNRKSLSKLASRDQEAFDLVFIDPPYAQQAIELDIIWLYNNGWIDHTTIIVCETDSKDNLVNQIAIYEKVKEKQYGQTRIHVYKGETND